MSETSGGSPAPASVDTSNAAPTESSEAIEDIDALEAEAGIEEASEEPTPKEVANLKKKYNLKVNNKVKELELDLGNDEEVQRYLQKAMASDEKFAEAANIRKGFAEFVQQLRTNPKSILMHPDIGVDVKQFAQQLLSEELDDMQKTPEQKKIEELEKALAAREAKEKELEEQKRQAEIAKIEEQTYQELDQQITEALGNSELPRTPYVVKRIADAMVSAIDMGYKNVSVAQIMPFVEQQIVSEMQQMYESAPEQSHSKLLEKFVGKKNLDKYRKARLSTAKAKAPVTAKSVVDTGSKPAESKAEAVEKVSVKKLLSW